VDLENEPSWVEESWLIQPRQSRESSKGLEALRHPSRPAAVDQVVADDREEHSLVRQAGPRVRHPDVHVGNQFLRVSGEIAFRSDHVALMVNATFLVLLTVLVAGRACLRFNTALTWQCGARYSGPMLLLTHDEHGTRSQRHHRVFNRSQPGFARFAVGTDDYEVRPEIAGELSDLLRGSVAPHESPSAAGAVEVVTQQPPATVSATRAPDHRPVRTLGHGPLAAV